jgi:hypothetical protein
MAYEIRALQLDLARQMETPAFIVEMARFAAANDYNTLVLYLEDRVRTTSYPYPDDHECYTTETMAAIVADATDLGLTVVPAVSNLGHTERFLRHAKLQKLAELSDDARGRFGGTVLNAVCPSSKKATSFFNDYFREVAELFPGPYFHIGCDEVWDFARCPACRKRLDAGKSEADLFAAHICRTHRFITRKLGKRVLMWDDMFEHYPEALPAVPNDIIMCDWHYEVRIDEPWSHFGGRHRSDMLPVYAAADIPVLICPADYHPDNAESLTAYANRTAPVRGGLMTTWEKGASFLYASLPTIGMAGRLWSGPADGDADQLLRDVCADTCGVADAQFLDLMQQTCTRRPTDCRLDPTAALCGPLTSQERDARRSADLLLRALQPWRQRVRTPLGGAVIDDLLVSLRRERLSLRLRETVPAVAARAATGDVAGATAALQPVLETVRAEIAALQALRREHWERWRPGLQPIGTDPGFSAALAACDAFAETLAAGVGLLEIDFFLPDLYGSPQLALACRSVARTKWRELLTDAPKPPHMGEPLPSPYFRRQYLVPADLELAELRVAVTGHGGLGLRFAHLRTPQIAVRPVAVRDVFGTVVSATAVLDDDTRWTYCGHRSVAESYFDDSLAAEAHGLVLEFGEA